ncbi:MAG: zf-HC2 domain-containing protein [Candidatus Solibacter usitatus]|nr:zf-HC2 domain-containing protein [Candidatus Solibacter usitatus]
MNSQQEAALLLDYCAGRLEAGAARDVERHLAECARCTEFVAGQQALWNVMNSWQAPPVSADFDRHLDGRLRETDSLLWIERVTRALRPAFARPPLALAAVCLVMAAGMLLRNPRASVAPSVDSHARMEQIEPEQVEKALDDMQMLRELSSAPSTDAASPKTL